MQNKNVVGHYVLHVVITCHETLRLCEASENTGVFAHVARPFHFPISANKVFDFAVTNKWLLFNMATILDFNYSSIFVVT